MGYWVPGSRVKTVSNQTVSADMDNFVLPLNSLSFLQEANKIRPAMRNIPYLKMRIGTDRTAKIQFELCRQSKKNPKLHLPFARHVYLYM